MRLAHILGFSHPDADMARYVLDGATPGANVHHAGLAAAAAGGDDDASSFNASAFCRDPWGGVTEGVYGGGTEVKDSIMKALTQHNPRVCLTEDDLEGLNVLYPSCSTPITQKPNCFKYSSYIGIVRFGMYTLLPVLLALVLLTMLNACVRRHHLERIASRDVRLRQKEVEVTEAQREAKKEAKLVSRLAQHIRTQREEEEARVEARAEELAATRTGQVALHGGPLALRRGRRVDR